MDKSNVVTMPGAADQDLTPPFQWMKADQNEYAGGLVRPGYAGDAGYDLCASRIVTVPARGMARVPTNMKVAIPPGFWAMVIGRSSTFFKRQLLVQTAVIDNGYRGEIWCVVKNLTAKAVTIQRAERVCQMVLYALHVPPVEEVGELPISDRGDSGFGSTGVEGK